MKAIKTNLHFRYGRFGARSVQNMSTLCTHTHFCLLSRCFVFNLINISSPIKDMSLFDVVATKFARRRNAQPLYLGTRLREINYTETAIDSCKFNSYRPFL